ncbi:MAG: hypothetical protein QM784_07800 [Polyangiaceae bacterium]
MRPEWSCPLVRTLGKLKGDLRFDGDRNRIPVLKTHASWLLAAALVSLTGSVYAQSLRRATKVSVVDDEKAAGRAEVVVSFSAIPKFSARFERQARRLVIDVAESELGGADPTILHSKGPVAGVLTQAYSDNRGKLVRNLDLLSRRRSVRSRCAWHGSRRVARSVAGFSGDQGPFVAGRRSVERDGRAGGLLCQS